MCWQEGSLGSQHRYTHQCIMVFCCCFFLHICTDHTLRLHGNISRYMTRTDFRGAGRDGERETECDHSGVRDKPRVKVAGDVWQWTWWWSLFFFFFYSVSAMRWWCAGDGGDDWQWSLDKDAAIQNSTTTAFREKNQIKNKYIKKKWKEKEDTQREP